MGEAIISRAGMSNPDTPKLEWIPITEIITENKVWTMPSNCRNGQVDVFLIGGGADSTGGNGGGSGWMNNSILAIASGVQVPITIGRNAPTSQTSSFGTYLSANGGVYRDGGAGGGAKSWSGGSGYQFGGGGSGSGGWDGQSNNGRGGNGGIWGGGGGGGGYTYIGVSSTKIAYGGNGGLWGGKGGDVSPSFGVGSKGNNGTNTISINNIEFKGTAIGGNGGTNSVDQDNYTAGGGGGGGGGYGGNGGNASIAYQWWYGGIRIGGAGGGGGGYGSRGGNAITNTVEDQTGGRGGGGGGYGSNGGDANSTCGGFGGGWGLSNWGCGGGAGSPSGINGKQGICIIKYYQLGFV